jgi:hypothetical protein
VFIAGLEGAGAVNTRLEGTWREARFLGKSNRAFRRHTRLRFWRVQQLRELMCSCSRCGSKEEIDGSFVFSGSLVGVVVGGSALVLDESDQPKAAREGCATFARP